MNLTTEHSEYVTHQLSNIINIHKIVTLNYFEFENTFHHRGERHNFWELVYVDKGNLLVETESGEISLTRGECIFHRPNEFHAHKADGVAAPNYFVLGFVCNSSHIQFFRKNRFKLSPTARGYISNILIEAKNVFELPINNSGGRELKLSSNESIGGQQMIRTYLEQLLISLIREQYGKTNPERAGEETSEENLVGQMRKKLDMYIYQKISVETFCKEMNYSKAYLSRIFLNACDCTIHDYIINAKVKEAKTLIREQLYNFTQISDMLCFSNPFYFSRVFKKKTGMSPSEYKNSIKTD